MYETAAGDTWDTIALFVYGNEKYAGFLMQNNPFWLGTVIFADGTLVYTPDVPVEEETEMPEWRD